MADRGGERGRGGGFGGRGRGRGGRGRGRRGGKSDEKEWQPVTKLGRLVKAGKINSMEEIYLHSLPIKEYQIVDNFLPKLKDEVMKVRSAPDDEMAKPTLSMRWTTIDERLEFKARRGFDWKQCYVSVKGRNADVDEISIPSRQPLSSRDHKLFSWSHNANQYPLYRSSPSRSRPVPVSVPASRPLSSLVTPRATSVSVSRPPRRLPPPSAPLSSLPSSLSSPSVVATGATTLVSLTPCPARSPASAVPSPSASFPLPAVPASLPLPLSSASSSSLVLRMLTLPLPVPPRPLRTPSRPPSSPSPTPTASLAPTCGRRPSSSSPLLRSSLTLSAMVSVCKWMVKVTRWGGLYGKAKAGEVTMLFRL